MERNVSIDHFTQECGCNPLYTTRAFAIADPLPGTCKKKKKGCGCNEPNVYSKESSIIIICGAF